MITKEQVEDYRVAKDRYDELKESISDRVYKVGRAVADLKVFRDEDVCDDPGDDWYSGDDAPQVFEGGLERDIVDISFEKDKLAIYHTDEYPTMSHVTTLCLITKSEYVWNEKLFSEEILKPLKVFEEEAQAVRDADSARWKAKADREEKAKYEELKAKFGE